MTGSGKGDEGCGRSRLDERQRWKLSLGEELVANDVGGEADGELLFVLHVDDVELMNGGCIADDRSALAKMKPIRRKNDPGSRVKRPLSAFLGIGSHIVSCMGQCPDFLALRHGGRVQTKEQDAASHEQEHRDEELGSSMASVGARIVEGVGDEQGIGFLFSKNRVKCGGGTAWPAAGHGASG